jgi:CDGSH-type Zn-finger protein
MLTMPRTPRPASITAYPDGPLVVRGDVELRTVDGEPIPRRSGPVALCRCGLSSIKPFCDSTHTRSGFRTDPGHDGADRPGTTCG